MIPRRPLKGLPFTLFVLRAAPARGADVLHPMPPLPAFPTQHIKSKHQPDAISLCAPQVFLFYMLVRNLFGGGAKAPPPGLAFRPAVTHGDPLSMRVFITEQPEIDLDSVSTRPAWQELEFSLPLAAEKTQSVTYRPSKVLQAISWSIHLHHGLLGLHNYTSTFLTATSAAHLLLERLLLQKAHTTQTRHSNQHLLHLQLQAVQNNGTLYLHTVFEASVIEKSEEDPLGTPRTLEWIRSWRESPIRIPQEPGRCCTRVLFYASPAPAAARDFLNAEGAYGSRDLVHTSE